MEGGLTIGWIIGLCFTTVMAVIGWTVTVSQALRMRVFQKLEKDQTVLAATVAANSTRIGVLETKYDTINLALAEIKLMLQKHLGV